MREHTHPPRRSALTLRHRAFLYPRCCRPVAGRQHRGCIIPQAVTHSLVLLKMGKIIAQNVLSWLELLISRYRCIKLVVSIIFLYIFFRLAPQSQFIPLQKVVYFITLSFLFRKIFTFYIKDVLLFKCPFPGPKGWRHVTVLYVSQLCEPFNQHCLFS
jgi:hypothetical protein